jgi:hypothetical protein
MNGSTRNFLAGLGLGVCLSLSIAAVQQTAAYDHSRIEAGFVDGDGLSDGTIYFAENALGAVGATETIDCGVSNKISMTLDENLTITLTAPTGPTNLTFRLTQDGAGTNTVTWPATVFWAGGSAPTITATASAVDIVSCYFDGTNYHCSIVQDMQ